MTETTPLFNQKGDVSRYNAAANREGEIFVECREEEPSVYEVENEITESEIVTAMLLEWQRNGANEDLAPQDIMAMHIQYRRVTHGSKVPRAHQAIMNELTDAMILYLRQSGFYNGDLCMVARRLKILRKLQENWPSIIGFNDNLARSLNVYHPLTYRERIQNAWMNCQNIYTVLENSISNFTCQLILSIILLSWPLSVMIMGAKFTSQCPMNNFLPDAMVAVGVVGISALLLRLMLASIEKWYWFPMRTVMTHLWTALKLVEFVFLVALAIQLWFFFKDSPSFISEDPKYCNETFYTFTFWMNHVSTAFAGVWLAAYIVKAVHWIMRFRYHYMPPFYDYTDINAISYSDVGQ